jgi:hypothetical protein
VTPIEIALLELRAGCRCLAASSRIILLTAGETVFHIPDLRRSKRPG